MWITIFSLIVLFFSIIIHEVAHGSMAYQLGDPTAKYAGRLSLNPIKHIDPFGTIILPLLLVIMRSPFVIGWAKPVPVNPYNFRDQKWGELKVAIAGPGANFLLVLIFGLSIRFLNLPSSVFIVFSLIAFFNLLLGLFNLIPIPPLDGSHILFGILPEKYNNIRFFLQQNGLLLLILFIFFGLPLVFGGVRVLYFVICGQPSPF